MTLKIKKEIIFTAKKLVDIGFNLGAEGNLSIRTNTDIYITPSGIDAYNLNDKQLDNVYKISSIQSIQNLTGQVDNNYKLFIEPLQKLQTALNSVSSKFTSSTPLNPNKLVNIIKDMPGGLDLKFKSLGNKTLSTIKNKHLIKFLSWIFCTTLLIS